MISERRKLSDPQLSRRFSKKKENCKESKVYYVSNYGTPHRTVKLKPPAVHKVTSVTSLTCTSSRALHPATPLKCSRSLSLQDLSPGIQSHLKQRRALVCSEGDKALTNMSDDANCLSDKDSILALRTYCRFLRNAWRKKSEDSELREICLKSANGQIAHLKLQISSLKNILKSDEQIISGSFREIKNLKTLLGKLQEQYEQCKKEKEEVSTSLDTVKEELQDVRTESFNDKNSLMLAKSEAAALEAQLEREREKIAKLKNDNRSLLDKVDKYSYNLKSKTEKINILAENVDHLEKQMSACTNLLRSSEIKIDEDKRAMEEASSCLRDLQKELGDAIEREGALRIQVEETTARLKDQAQEYNKVIKEQTLKMVRLEAERSLRAEHPLKTRLVRLAAGALNLPILLAIALAKGT